MMARFSNNTKAHSSYHHKNPNFCETDKAFSSRWKFCWTSSNSPLPFVLLILCKSLALPCALACLWRPQPRFCLCLACAKTYSDDLLLNSTVNSRSANDRFFHTRTVSSTSLNHYPLLPNFPDVLACFHAPSTKTAPSAAAFQGLAPEPRSYKRAAQRQTDKSLWRKLKALFVRTLRACKNIQNVVFTATERRPCQTTKCSLMPLTLRRPAL